jgi:hypothetical protein
MKKNNELLNFIIIGILNTLIGAMIMFIAYNIFRLGYWLSTSLNYIIAGTFSFYANKTYTFKSEGQVLKRIVLFILTVLICYLVSFNISKGITNCINIQNIKLKENISMIIGMIVYTILNFVLQKTVVFRKDKE